MPKISLSEILRRKEKNLRTEEKEVVDIFNQEGFKPERGRHMYKGRRGTFLRINISEDEKSIQYFYIPKEKILEVEGKCQKK